MKKRILSISLALVLPAALPAGCGGAVLTRPKAPRHGCKRCGKRCVPPCYRGGGCYPAYPGPEARQIPVIYRISPTAIK